MGCKWQFLQRPSQHFTVMLTFDTTVCTKAHLLNALHSLLMAKFATLHNLEDVSPAHSTSHDLHEDVLSSCLADARINF